MGMIHKMMNSTILVLLCSSALAMKVRPGSAPAVKLSPFRAIACALGLSAAATGAPLGLPQPTDVDPQLATIAGDDLVPCDVPTITQSPVATCQLVDKTEPTYEIHPTTRGRNDDRPAKSATCDSWCKIECSTTSDKCCGGLPACKGCSFCVSVTAAATKDKRDISGAAAAARELFERGQRFWAEQRGRNDDRPAKSATCDSWCKIECSTTGDKCC